MIEKIQWIINPIAHRKKQRLFAEAMYEKNKKVHEQNGFFFIDTLVDNGLPDDLWVCDLCNVQMNVEIHIPVVDNLAMCETCYKTNEKYITPKTMESECTLECCEMEEKYAT